MSTLNNLQSLGHYFVQGFWDFLYPPICIHCRLYLKQSCSILCKECKKQLLVLKKERRCRHCFKQSEQKICSDCQVASSFLDSYAAVFDYEGPAQTLIKQLKYAGRLDLAQGMGAMLAVQFLQLKWPMPDYLVPVPLASRRFLERGYNQSEELAKELGKILQVPVRTFIKRKTADFSQASLNREQRLLLSPNAFSLTCLEPLVGKTLLIIDDVYTTGKTIDACAYHLAIERPNAIFALTFCRSY